MAERRLTADLRMWRHSGIGRYLQNLVPLLLPELHCEKIRVLGSAELFGDAAFLRDPRVELVEERSPIYSIGEQTAAFRGRFASTSLLWVPHFNVPLLYRGRLLVTMHDIAPLALPEILGSTVKRAYARLLIETAVRRAAAILCVSEFTRSELIAKLHATPAKLHVTYPGLDAAWPRTAPPHVEADGTPYILFVGNVKPNKNLRLLLEALRRVQAEVPFRVVLAGRMTGLGTADEAVIDAARSFGDRVRFAGEVSDAALHSLYAGAAALCLPSRYEGFGLPLLEAMALGCPVLASNAGSLPEVAGDAALFFSPDDPQALAGCLRQVLNPAVTQRLRDLGRARIQNFSFAACARQTAAVMNQLMETAI